ncbi:hypothetical protein [Streptomyces sp. NPDC047061]|uniref:hypothetical protein n=1 Tax=Streptomyces sp. NPDC047061 TaxID=3154605 RepID=UPI00340ED59D
MIFNRRRPSPHLAPELDDSDLGKACRQFDVRNNPRGRPLTEPIVKRLLHDAGRDWDRRAHRLAVLGATISPGSQYALIEQSPGTPDVHNLLAWGAMVRGAHSALSYSEVTDALQACNEAARLDPSDPSPWVARLGLLRQWRHPREEVFAVWKEISARDRWHREAHLQMYGYLSPDECGSHAQALEFVDRVRTSTPTTAPIVGLPLFSLVDRYLRTMAHGGVNALMADHFWSGQEADTVLRNAAALWPQTGRLVHAEALRDLNLLAFSLVAARRAPLAAPVFHSLEGVVTEFPWNHAGQDPVTAFDNAQRKAGPV